jgi:hypothetical protein
VAKRATARPGKRARKRSRRRSPAAEPAPQTSARQPKDAPRPTATTPRRRRPARSVPLADRDPGGFGERPQAPWHPFPLAELLILIGLIAVAVGMFGKHTPALLAGVGAVLLGTLEFTVREHLSGYRAHSSLLAAVPTALFHGGVALGLSALGVPSAALILVPLALDVPLFFVLFKLLRARFDDARRERVQGVRS